MDLMQTISCGKTPQPPRILTYGMEGIGKSTYGASAPKPIFIQTEDGLQSIDTSKFPLSKSYDDVVNQLTALATAPHEYLSCVIDSIDWLERLIWAKECKDYGVKNIEKVDGGYGKGYVIALSYWQRLVDLLMRLRDERKMAIILLSHAKVETFHDPENGDYDRFSPRIHKHAASLLTEWCDVVNFATWRMVVGADRKASAIGENGGERVLKCIGSPSFVAKNRYQLPAELPLSWKAFQDALTKNNSKE